MTSINPRTISKTHHQNSTFPFYNNNFLVHFTSLIVIYINFTLYNIYNLHIKKRKIYEPAPRSQLTIKLNISYIIINIHSNMSYEL